MKLTRLQSHTLKVYLTLIEERGAGDRCPLSRAILIRKTRLSRNLVHTALAQLESRGLIVPQAPGWWVRIEPLEWLLPPWRDEADSKEKDIPALVGSWN